jgi:hypothetical protein
VTYNTDSSDRLVTSHAHLLGLCGKWILVPAADLGEDSAQEVRLVFVAANAGGGGSHGGTSWFSRVLVAP